MAGTAHRRAYWICQILGWGLYCAAGFVFLLIFAPEEPLRRYVVIYASGAVIAIACTHVYRGFLRRRRWSRLPPAAVLPRVLAASAMIGAAITVLLAVVFWLVFNRSQLASAGWSWVYPALYTWIFSSFIWNIAYFAVHYFEQYRSAEIESLHLAVVAQESNLRALLAQLNPHFLFNCLNSLRGLIGEDPARAQAMVTELAQLLRYSLASGRRAAVPLAEELEAVRAYLQLEAIRLEERLRVEISAAPEALAAALPPMLLQTLVENGVKHGVAPAAGGGWLRIAATLEDGRLRLEVGNSGQLAPTSPSTRLGIENARARLRLLYGDAASLSLANRGSDSVLAQVSLPWGPARTVRP